MESVALFGTVEAGGTIKRSVGGQPVVKGDKGRQDWPEAQNYGTITEVSVVSPKVYSASGSAAGFDQQ